MAKIKIESDCLNISKRIKDIDESYYILYNLETKKYEVHSNNQPFSSYCFTSPYNFLDERLLTYTLKTRKQNIDKLILEMEKENEKFINNEKKKLKEQTLEELERNGEE